MSRSIIADYYNQKKIPFGICGDRRDKIFPLVANLKGKKVLEVGCATGYMGVRLRKQGNYVVGLDISKKDIQKAKKVLDRAYVVDLESDDLPKMGTKFDLILITEVIEHLFDPDTVLKKILTVLKPNGEVLISTLNFLHLYNRYRMLKGKFEYVEETIVNKSHIHFFTYSTLNKMLSSLGLRVVKENNIIFPRTLAAIWKTWPELFAYHMVFLCKKNE